MRRKYFDCKVLFSTLIWIGVPYSTLMGLENVTDNDGRKRKVTNVTWNEIDKRKPILTDAENGRSFSKHFSNEQ